MAGDVLPLNLLEPGEQPVPYATGNILRQGLRGTPPSPINLNLLNKVMGQAKEQLGGLPMPHEAMGDSSAKVDRMAGSAFNEQTFWFRGTSTF